MSWNIRSLEKNYEEFESHFNSGEFSVICINESWLGTNQHSDMFRLPVYKLYRYDRKA